MTDPTAAVMPDPPANLLVPLGRVAAPPEYESTSGTFYFWIDRDQSVERTQIVSTRSAVAGRQVRFVGVAQEVYRRSRQKDVHEEAARYDGRTTPPEPGGRSSNTNAADRRCPSGSTTSAPPARGTSPGTWRTPR